MTTNESSSRNPRKHFTPRNVGGNRLATFATIGYITRWPSNEKQTIHQRTKQAARLTLSTSDPIFSDGLVMGGGVHEVPLFNNNYCARCFEAM